MPSRPLPHLPSLAEWPLGHSSFHFSLFSFYCAPQGAFFLAFFCSIPNSFRYADGPAPDRPSVPA